MISFEYLRNFAATGKLLPFIDPMVFLGRQTLQMASSRYYPRIEVPQFGEVWLDLSI